MKAVLVRMRQDLLDKWMSTQPDCVKQLAKEFPLHTTIWMPAPWHQTWYVIGWTEADALMVSPITLAEDYDRAMDLHQCVCAEHYR